MRKVHNNFNCGASATFYNIIIIFNQFMMLTRDVNFTETILKTYLYPLKLMFDHQNYINVFCLEKVISVIS